MKKIISLLAALVLACIMVAAQNSQGQGNPALDGKGGTVTMKMERPATADTTPVDDGGETGESDDDDAFFALFALGMYVGWFVLCLHVSNVAAKQGRSRMGWYIATLIFSPFLPWLALAFIPDKE